MTGFSRYILRTTDAPAAHRFYAELFGHDRAVIWPLHEQALARGAKPHWLGHLGVDDVEHAAQAFLERGAMRLGPTFSTREGCETAVLRDPGGAVVAVLSPPPTTADTSVDVFWHVLHTNDLSSATANYVDFFGWHLTDRVDLGVYGVFQQFAWSVDGPSVGAMGDIAARPGVHPHWLFFFPVASLEEAIAKTRAAGGLALGPIVMPSGERACACDDPQGAAFGLIERTVRG